MNVAGANLARFLFPRFREELAQYGARAFERKTTIIAQSGRDEVFYVPFDYVKTDAKLVLVGITPGPTQIELAYNAAQKLIKQGCSDKDVVLGAKQTGGFGGNMRTNLLKMLKHFKVARILGIAEEADLWGASNHLFYGTSVIPHAAFASGKMFAGPFGRILQSDAFNNCFQMDFIPALQEVNSDALYIGLGRVVDEALHQCVENGVIKGHQLLGSLAHPSGSGGSMVQYFLREKALEALTSNDPVRGRAAWLDKAYEEMKLNCDRKLATLQIHD